MNRIEKLANINLISAIFQRVFRSGCETYSHLEASLSSDISDNQQDCFPERQLHKYMATLRETMWQ
ncbi:MAG: hypothetical protein COC24_003800 [Alphaproteobacteria bacterium]|nr:hypothetical protein [Alphaproteobacteria bacterium]